MARPSQALRELDAAVRREPNGMTLGEQERDFVVQLLSLRRDVRWRRGVLQVCVSLRIFTQREWEILTRQIRDATPRLPPR